MQKKEYKTMFEFEDNYWWYNSLHEINKYYIDFYSNKNKDTKIFDAGCGTGKMLKILENYNFTEGIDISEEAILFCKKRNLKNIRKDDLNTWTAEKNKYDFIISSDVICSIGIKNETDILKKFYSSLKPNGKLILNLPALKILGRNHDKSVFIRKRYKKSNFIKEIKEIGFEINIATYRYFSLFFIILLKKFLEKFSKKQEIKSDLKPIPEWLNKLFRSISKIEKFFIVHGIYMPLGSSLFIVASQSEKKQEF